jgi:hypothetical protein
MRGLFDNQTSNLSFFGVAIWILALTFREIQNPDRLDTFDVDKLTLKIITSARKHQILQTFQFFAKK